MIKARLYLPLLLLLFLLFLSCKKDSSTEPTIINVNSCNIYSTVSSDTNYVPHKKGNHWTYCSGNINYAGWSAGISLDTMINNKVYFNRIYHTSSSHAPYSTFENKSFIDSLGNYFSITNQSGYFDTLLLIKPTAVVGDTIYNNQSTHVKVVLKNNNETVKNITNCYYSLVIYPNGFQESHYYKKGIGELFFWGFTLDNAQIN